MSFLLLFRASGQVLVEKMWIPLVYLSRFYVIKTFYWCLFINYANGKLLLHKVDANTNLSSLPHTAISNLILAHQSTH